MVQFLIRGCLLVSASVLQGSLRLRVCYTGRAAPSVAILAQAFRCQGATVLQGSSHGLFVVHRGGFECTGCECATGPPALPWQAAALLTSGPAVFLPSLPEQWKRLGRLAPFGAQVVDAEKAGSAPCDIPTAATRFTSRT